MSSSELSDEQVFEVTKILYNGFRDEQNQKKLDEDHLEQFKKLYIKPLYPHKQLLEGSMDEIQKYSCDEYCCELDPGRFLCCNSTPPDDQYRDFGVGVCMYVKFLKHLTCFLFFVSVLAVVAVLCYYLVAIETEYEYADNYKNFIFAGTTGMMASQFSQCEYSLIDATPSASFQLKCSAGEINLLGVVLSGQTLRSLQNCRFEADKIQAESFQPAGLSETKSCSDSMDECNITVTMTSNEYEGETYEYASYAFECVHSEYTLGSLTLSSPILTYVVLGIDIAIIIFFLFFLCSEDKAEDKEEQYFKTKELALNDFAVKVSGFTLTNIQNQIDFFVKGYHNEAEEMTDGEDLFSNIVQIKIPQSEQVRNAIENRRKSYSELYQFIDSCFFEEMIDPNKYRDADDFLKKCYGTAEAPEYIEYKKLLSEMIETFLQSKKAKIYKEKETPVDILVVLSNPRFKRQIMRKAKHECFSKKIHVQDRKYQVSEPPVADMILWQNTHKWTCLRVIFIWIITFGICFCSYLLVGLAQYEKERLVSDNAFEQDCGIIYDENQLKTWDSSLKEEQNYLNCYCDYNYLDIPSDSDIRGRCYDWAVAYGTYLAIPILISLGIVLYNLIISRFFKLMTKFEGHSEVTAELYSYIMKRSFVLIMNMGLIMILLKLDFNDSWNDQNLYFLFLGTYNDVTADWYLQIGVVITLTLGINILIPFMEMMFLSFLKCLRKCWDKKCYCRKTSQKTKKGYLELYANDVFPIEERYADLVAIIVITLAFSGVMPGLYIIAFFSLMFMSVCDKLLLFRVYQKPINYTASLQSKIYKTLYIALMIHCAASAFLLSQPHLVDAGNLYEVKFASAENERLNSIVTIPYLMAYVILFFLLAIWGFFHTTLVSAIKYCTKKCSKSRSRIFKRKLNQDFFQSLNAYQVNRLKLSMQKQLHRNVSHTRSKIKVQTIKSLSETEINIRDSVSDKKHMTELICQNTLNRLREIDTSKKFRSKKDNIMLIGHAGYEEIYDDQVFERERKIKHMDYQLNRLLRRRGGNQENKNTARAATAETIEIQF